MYIATGIISHTHQEIPLKVISYVQNIFSQRFIYLSAHKNFNIAIFSFSTKEQKVIFETDDELCFVLCEINNKSEIAKIAQISETNSDAELLFNAYKNVNKKIFQKCYGKWIFIKKNKSNNIIEIWRDHVGMYSLYYFIKNDAFYFSTHLGTLLQYDNSPKQLNKMLIASLILGYTGKSDETIFNEIYKAPAASNVIISKHNYNIQRYWQIKKNIIKYKNEIEYYEHFEYILNQAINENINFDDTIACTLSSGLDSSFLTARIATILQNKNIYAITSIPVKEFKEFSEGRRYGNEEPLARLVAKKYSNIIHIIDDANENNIIDLLKKSLIIHGYPLRNAINQHWIISMFEKLAMYNVNKLFIAQMGNLTVSWPFIIKKNNILFKINNILNTKFPTKKIIKQHKEYFNKNFLRANNFHYYLWKNDYFPYFDSFISYNKRKYFLNQLLLQGFSSWNDKGIFYGINVIDPFADPRIVEYCYSIPEYLFEKSKEKRLFIKAISKNYIPEEIINNSKKAIQAADIRIRIENEINEIQKLLKFSSEINELNEILDTSKLQKILFENKIKNHVFLRVLLIILFYQFVTLNNEFS